MAVPYWFTPPTIPSVTTWPNLTFHNASGGLAPEPFPPLTLYRYCFDGALHVPYGVRPEFILLVVLLALFGSVYLLALIILSYHLLAP